MSAVSAILGQGFIHLSDLVIWFGISLLLVATIVVLGLSSRWKTATRGFSIALFAMFLGVEYTAFESLIGRSIPIDAPFNRAGDMRGRLGDSVVLLRPGEGFYVILDTEEGVAPVTVRIPWSETLASAYRSRNPFLGEPRPLLAAEERDIKAGKHPVITAIPVPGVAIYLLVYIGSNAPVYYEMPWNDDLNGQLRQAQAEAQINGSAVEVDLEAARKALEDLEASGKGKEAFSAESATQGGANDQDPSQRSQTAARDLSEGWDNRDPVFHAAPPSPNRLKGGAPGQPPPRLLQ